MEHEKFLDAIKWTKKTWADRKSKKRAIRKRKCRTYSDFSYPALRKRGDDYWLHLERMSKDELAEEIINCFLNTREYNCHLPKPETSEGQKLVQNLKNAVEKLRDAYAALAGSRIEDMEFGADNLFLIDRIYSTFRQTKPKFGAVPASKLMHMALPNLFVMWDDDIIEEYGVKKQVLPCFGRRIWSYTAFLILMQENIRHIKETNPRVSSVTNEELFRQINGQCGEKDLPITRLLDIANYAVSRKGSGIKKCSKCIQVTKGRLGALEWYDKLAKPAKPFFDC